MLKISIIIPSYMPGDYLYDCLNSINEQSISTHLFEVVIILNGPREPYYSRIQKAISPYPNFYLLYENNPGVSNARNVGIENSKGEYICFIDDDDIISSSYLERLLDCATEDTICMSNVYSFKNKVNERRENFFICGHLRNKHLYEDASFYTCRSFFAFPVAKMIHRNIIGMHRFNTRFSNGEDALFITSITDNVAHISFTSDDAIYYVRERPNSASRKKINLLKILSDSLLLIIEYIKVYISNPKQYSIPLFLARIPGVLKNAWFLYRN